MDISSAASVPTSQIQSTGLLTVDGGSAVTTEIMFTAEEAMGVMDFALAATVSQIVLPVTCQFSYIYFVTFLVDVLQLDPPGIFVSSEILGSDTEATVVFDGITCEFDQTTS